jgi:hypothetical protein
METHFVRNPWWDHVNDKAPIENSAQTSFEKPHQTPRGAIMTAVFLLGVPSHRPPEQRIGINA